MSIFRRMLIQSFFPAFFLHYAPFSTTSAHLHTLIAESTLYFASVTKRSLDSDDTGVMLFYKSLIGLQPMMNSLKYMNFFTWRGFVKKLASILFIGQFFNFSFPCFTLLCIYKNLMFTFLDLLLCDILLFLNNFSETWLS